MPFADLREFLACLERHHELVHVTRPVALEHEVGAVTYKLAQSAGPALMFDRPGGGSVPLVVELITSPTRFALALETSVENIHAEWIRRIARPLPPRRVATGSCKENIRTGDAADVLKFPIPVWNELDAGPYIDQGVLITQDPETGVRRTNIPRIQVHGARRLGLGLPRDTLNGHRRKWGKEKPFPVAIAIGTDPSLVMTAMTSYPEEADELAVAGALRGQPVDVVPCETVPLEVPATAEIVIEGEWDQKEEEDEGPYGAMTGYYTLRAKRPVIRVTAITHRHNPIHNDHYNGRVSAAFMAVSKYSREIDILRQISIPGVKKLAVPPGSRTAPICIVSIEQRYEGHGKTVGMAILGTERGRQIKTVIVVDSDVDPENWNDVEWALATRMQPHRDVLIIPGAAGGDAHFDPSLSSEDRAVGRSSKMIIDATKFNARDYPTPCVPKPDVLAEVERNWRSYGIERR